jgi:ketosteroid isomerase-like protein
MRFIIIRFAVALITFAFGTTAAYLLPSRHSISVRKHNPCAESAVLQVEDEYLRAYRERDVAALNRILADNFTVFHGRVTKADRLALLSNPDFIVDSLDTTETDVNVDGNDAWVSGKAHMSGSYMGRDFHTRPYRFRRHYERTGAGWQIVSCEFSPIW